MNWTSKEDEILIDFVKSNEALYDLKSKDYRKAQMKQHLWNVIGNSLGKPGADCVKRWTYVRDYYIRRRGKPGKGSGGEAAKKRANLLLFLDSIPSCQRSSLTNVGRNCTHIMKANEDQDVTDLDASQVDFQENFPEEIEIVPDSVTTQIDSTCNENKNRDEIEKRINSSHLEERLQLLKEIAQHKTPPQHDLDETDLFFSSMAKIVRKLPRHEQIKLRIEIGSLVGNAELRCLEKYQ